MNVTHHIVALSVKGHISEMTWAWWQLKNDILIISLLAYTKELADDEVTTILVKLLHILFVPESSWNIVRKRQNVFLKYSKSAKRILTIFGRKNRGPYVEYSYRNSYTWFYFWNCELIWGLDKVFVNGNKIRIIRLDTAWINFMNNHSKNECLFSSQIFEKIFYIVWKLNINLFRLRFGCML